jgi:hypothetical protein
MVTIERASEVFVHGFAFTRSFTHPCVAAPVVPGVWVVRDAPPKSTTAGAIEARTRAGPGRRGAEDCCGARLFRW